jgi:hypothetical protein
MVAGTLGTFDVKEGRGDEFLAILSAQKAWAEGHGAVVRVRRTAIGGPESGGLSLTFLFEDPAARGAFMDAGAADTANNPLGKMLRSADRPAAPLGRVFFNEIGESSGIADSSPLQIGLVFSVGAGQRVEAESTLDAVKERFAGLGAQSLNFRVSLGGSGAAGGLKFARVVGHDSWAAYEATMAANQALDTPAPLTAAIASGALTVVSQSSTIDVAV